MGDGIKKTISCVCLFRCCCLLVGYHVASHNFSKLRVLRGLNDFLRVIPTLRHYSDIVSNIPIWKYILDLFSDILSDLLSGIWHILWHSFWRSIWQLFRHSLRHGHCQTSTASTRSQSALPTEIWSSRLGSGSAGEGGEGRGGESNSDKI